MKASAALLLAATVVASPHNTAQDLTTRQDEVTVRAEILSVVKSGAGCDYDSNIEIEGDNGKYQPGTSDASVHFGGYFIVPDLNVPEDRDSLSRENRASRSCTVKVKMLYPVGCSNISLMLSTKGFYQVEGDSSVLVSRRYRSTTGTMKDVGPDVFRSDTGSDEPMVDLFALQDDLEEDVDIKAGMQEQTFTAELTAEVTGPMLNQEENMSNTQLENFVFRAIVNSNTPSGC